MIDKALHLLKSSSHKVRILEAVAMKSSYAGLSAGNRSI